jgi:hypothetical protein
VAVLSQLRRVSEGVGESEDLLRSVIDDLV